jgi:hypothetical protein
MLLIRGCSSAGRAPALQAGGRRFESDHLHHCPWIKDGGWSCSGGYRGEAKAIGVDGFNVKLRRRRCLQIGGAGSRGDHRIWSGDDDPGVDLCKCESGSGASLGATIVKSDRMFRHPAMVRCSEANCCVLSKSDFCFAQCCSRQSLIAEDGFCAWWIPGFRPGG